MKKFWKKKLIFKALTLILLFGFWLARSAAVQAADLEVTFESEPLFSQAADGDWYPGRTESRWTQVINYSNDNRDVIIDTFNEQTAFVEDLAEVLEIVISRGGNDLYGGSLGTKYLKDFYAVDELFLNTLADGQIATYDFQISLDPSLGNDWQGKDTGFDFQIGFKGAVATPTPVLPGMIAGEAGETVILGEATSAGDQLISWWWLLFLFLLPLLYYWYNKVND